ncbi:MAG: hypothetical protein CVU05_13110 [Bacteroidetes bacterium HGW-Bacteroidetes-21]|nr:MAG: hypothetical protein CVU05_13110 [Bacteroidetes bacterium HGW-Bacteroidetes-21]
MQKGHILNIKERFIKVSDVYLRLILSAFLAIFLLRIAEYIFINTLDTFHVYVTWEVFLKGAILDLILMVRSALLFFPVFLLFFFIGRNIHVIIWFIGLFLILLLSVFLILFTAISGTLLDSVVLYYSADGATHVISNYLGLVAWFIALPILIFSITIFSFRYLPVIRSFWIRVIIATLFLVTAFVPYYASVSAWSGYNKLTEMNLQNKVLFLLQDIYVKYKEDQVNSALTKQLVESYYQYYPDKKPIDTKFPLIYNTEDMQDVLSPLMDSFTTKPNIVVIIGECLGRDVSGPGSLLGSFTPFLDSLAGQSLYWPNTISTTERTFGALPAIFSSLPLSKEGFISMGTDMPLHNSLIHNLKNNDYVTRYYYGGWGAFDNMSLFFCRQNGDYFLQNFGNKFSKMDDDGDFCWGYGDKELAERSFEVVDSMKNSPSLDIYLTLTNHMPWEFKGQDYYFQKVKKKLEASVASPDVKDEISKSIPRLSAVMYMDDAIRKIIEGYKSRENFDNTIFIITGDHALGNHQNISLSTYHIPLIIYSTKITKARVFKAVASHLDIAPTLEAFLGKSCGLKFPEVCHYIGTSLDTCHYYRNQKKQIFQKNNRKVNQMIFENYYLDNDILYEVDSNFHQKKVELNEVRDSVSKILKDVKNIHFALTKNELIISDLLFIKGNELGCIHPKTLQNEKGKQLLQSIKTVSSHEEIILKEGNEYEDIAFFKMNSNQINVGYLDMSFDYTLLNSIEDPKISVVFACQDTTGKDVFWKSFSLVEWKEKVNQLKIYATMPFRVSNKRGINSIKIYLWTTNKAEIKMFNTQLKLYVE